MNKPLKIKRSPGDLRRALAEQVSLLISYCEHFDRGELAFSKPMATSLRVLLHHNGKNAHALLHQLDLRSGRYFSIPSPINPRNLLSECNLVLVSLDGNKGQVNYQARLEKIDDLKRRVPFPEWWTRPVAKAANGEVMSRMAIVRSVTDMDGGAHVDGEFSIVYERFRSGAFLGWISMFNAQEEQLVASPQYACIRTIAHELLLSLQKYAAWCFGKPYEFVPTFSAS